MSRLPLVSVVIVNHNGGEYVRRCLDSVLNTNYPNFEVTLLDSASTDRSIELVKKTFSSIPSVRIVRSLRNISLGKARNICAKHSKGKYIAFLDHDTKVDPQWLDELVRVMELDSSIGAAQCKFLLMDDPERFDSAGHYIDYVGVATIIGHLEYDQGQYDHIYEIFGAQGGAFIIRGAIFEEIGGEDPDFLYLFDETDLCWRVWLAGYRIVFVPRAIVYHKGGGTARRIGNERVVYLFTKNRITSILKNYDRLSLLSYLPIHIMLMLGFSLVKIKKSHIKEAGAVIKAIIWNLLNLRKIWQKRSRVQSTRRVSDKIMFQRGLIKRPRFERILERIRSP